MTGTTDLVEEGGKFNQGKASNFRGQCVWMLDINPWRKTSYGIEGQLSLISQKWRLTAMKVGNLTSNSKQLPSQGQGRTRNRDLVPCGNNDP
jgi:hypothetical protein